MTKHPQFLNILSIMNYKIFLSLLIIFFLCHGFKAFCQGQITRPTKQQSQTSKTQKSVPEVTVSEPDGYINGYGFVDLGLPSGTKWSTCNIGAQKPSEYGDYFAWGELKPKSNYDWANCFDCIDDYGGNWKVYNSDGRKQITPKSGHDTARENWKGTWRMPTMQEMEELIKNCKWTWATNNGHIGYSVKGVNGHTIFFPAANYRMGTSSFDGVCGVYWSNTLDHLGSSDAMSLLFGDSGAYTFSEPRKNGLSIRPVSK